MADSTEDIGSEKPLCFSTYIGEGDLLCGKCDKRLKKECMKFTEMKNHS